MIYSNLLIFLSAIILFSIDSVPERPAMSWPVCVLVLCGALAILGYLAGRQFAGRRAWSSTGYSRAERNTSILALVFFGGTLFFGDIKYYLSFLAFGDRFPALVNIAGLGLFLVFLSIMWLAARRSYRVVFGRSYSRLAFIALHIKTNLPIVLPWVVLSLVYDLLALAPFPGLKKITQSVWGDVLLLGLFLVFVIIFFPPLVRRLWGCRELPTGPVKEHLLSFCARQQFKAKLYVWPLFEGQVLTAAVMGLLPGLRYILLTPAIMETMSIDELEAITAHEIGHIKKGHLLLYILLIGGFSVIAGFLAEPLLYYLLSRDWMFILMTKDILNPETLIGMVAGLPLLALLLVYFRFLFGYFIRNFERQADLHVFKVLGSSRSLISAFEKIVRASGQPAERKNWHHFGIGERIAFLLRCEREPELISRQDRKVRRSLVAYIVVLALAVAGSGQIPAKQLARDYQGKYIEMVLMPKIKVGEDKALWFRLMGDLLLNRKLEDKAMRAYGKALEIEPDDAELMNDLAWLLLTSEDSSLRDPKRALALADVAVKLYPKPQILDTLATAYWANGEVEKAVEIERRALLRDPDQADFYRRQLERFTSEQYSHETRIVN